MDEELLVAVYQNISTALQSINLVFEDLEEGELKNEIKREKDIYESFDERCHELADMFNIELKENNLFEKSKMWLNVKMSTMADKTVSHIAEMMLLGSFMGEIDMYKIRHLYKNANQDIMKLCNDTYDKEMEFCDKLKPFILK